MAINYILFIFRLTIWHQAHHSDHEVEHRIADVQNVPLDLEKCTTPLIAKYVGNYSSSTGYPKQYFLIPLQSIAAHFMGPNVKVHEGWSEPIILWGVVVAHKGEKKSPALGRELTKIEELKDNASEIQPQILVEHFSFEELRYTMKHNNNRILGLYDELSLLYEQLDHYKAGQADRKTILTINGGCWRRNFRSTTSTIRNTCFNITGFVQPATIAMIRMMIMALWIDSYLIALKKFAMTMMNTNHYQHPPHHSAKCSN